MAKQENKLSKHLTSLLSEYVPVGELDEVAKQLGDHGVTNARFVAEKIMANARQGKQWAIEMVRDSTEGRPGPAEKVASNDRTEERLNAVTAHHLNKLARAASGKPAAKSVPAKDVPAPEPKPAAPTANAAGDASSPARRLLDLPRNGHRNPQGAGVEPQVASGDSGPSGG